MNEKSRLVLLLSSLFVAACGTAGGVVETDGNSADQTDASGNGLDLMGGQELEGPGDALLDAAPDVWQFDAPEASMSETFLPCAAEEGCFLDPCGDNSECLSGWCVEHMGEGVCTQFCQEECPPGWTCQQTGTGPDLASICISKVSNLCKPCATTEGCKTVGGAEDVCVSYGDEGFYCGGGCTADEDCPWGFSCLTTVTVDGVSTLQCVADAGVCPCSGKSVALSLSTPCEVGNGWGVCGGKRVCAEEGLTECDAAVPALEVCNGIDDNCDGNVDEASFIEGKYVALCDDGDECTEDACKAEAGCEHAAISGDECKDGNPCTLADHCVDGICVGAQVECDDFNPCTDDTCNDTGGCVFAPNQGMCDDGDACTVGDQCSDGECAGYGVDCDCQEDSDCEALEDGDLCNGTLHCNKDSFPYACDVIPDSEVDCPAPEGNDAPCLTPVCDPLDGKCSLAAANDGALCDDGDKCTVGDLCNGGLCQGGLDANCNDGNECSDDSCEPAIGCLHVDNVLPCDDGDVCTLDDTCDGGLCVAGPGTLSCDDGNLCTDDGCEPHSGCTHANNQMVCDDGNACTLGDLCTGGGCQAGAGLVLCDDENPCTSESCDSELGCVYQSNTVPCDDGDPCTLNDQCANGECLAGAGANCDDGNPCTDDLCGDDGACQHVSNEADCDDGNACTLGDHCAAGNCVHSALVQCDDEDLCTNDSCDPGLGCLQLFNQAFCDDGDVCTLGDKCALGVCTGGALQTCNDGNPCTDDSCDPDDGCQYLPNQAECDDSNACTSADHCAGGACKGGAQIACDDDNICTGDSCDIELGCVYEFNAVPCDDGDLCTMGENCDLGDCTGGGPVNCNDGDVCTDDLCQPEVGCTHELNNAPCSDGNACTENDQCGGGICSPGGLLDCDDENVCTADSCDSVAGCEYAPADGDCEDGNQCTVNDTCGDSQCQPGDPEVCNDGNGCTDDSCAPQSGCVFVPNNDGCSDGNACTDGDTCEGGACVSGDALTCDDGKTCTSDSCNPNSGCLYANVANYTDCGGGKVCIDGDCTACPNPTGSKTFGFTGSSQSWVVPDCVEKVTIEVWGAQGGGSNGGEDGGKGGYSKGILAVTPGETLYIYSGGKGKNQSSGGWNGGGHGAKYGGGGGGGSDVRQSGTSLNHRKIVAGGGAGGQTGSPNHGTGGYGGGSTGQTGISNFSWAPGGGGSQSGGGSAGAQCYAGTFGSGGSKASYHVSGGGGGWYGGGCSYGGGGGGGSGYVGGVSNGSTSGNNNSGNGQVKFVW